jgi:hypothetical protein
MTQHEISAPSENRSYQAQLADSLIASLGLEGAAHACQANTWDGVLRFVLARRGDARGADA